MIRLYRCAGWSESVLYAHVIWYFSCDANHLENIQGNILILCIQLRHIFKPAHDFVANSRV